MNVVAPEKIPVETLVAEMPDIGNRLDAALNEFARNPNAPGAELLAYQLTGAAKIVLMVRAGLMARAASKVEARP
jgi:hypothetical protein